MEKYSKVLQKILIQFILWYRYFLSPMMGNQCRFEPTCSAYAMTAIQTLGCLKGMQLAIMRIFRCNPFCKGGYDPVPLKKASSTNSFEINNKK